ncbi:MAG: hypothetical protein AABY22_14915 [Nanoarchaeota archaeon]
MLKSFNQNQKLYNFWKASQENTDKIRIKIKESEAIVHEKHKTKTVSYLNKIVINLSSEWGTFIPADTNDSLYEGATIEAIKTWEIAVSGISFEEVIGIRHAYEIKTGSGTVLIDENFKTNTFILTSNYIKTSSLEDSINNRYTLLYGMFILNSSEGLEEIDKNGMQVRLNLTMVNPKVYI